MKERFFGDSYDIVKQSLLRWLRPLGTWRVHPMFTTKPVDPEFPAKFARFLDAPLLTTAVLDTGTVRTEYFAVARQRREHLFFDPDTGLRANPQVRRNKAPSYLFQSELLTIANRHPESLTLVFDQSLAHGREEQELRGKLSYLESQGLAAIAYSSHACFILVGRDKELVAKAQATLLCESRLPVANKQHFVGVVTAMESLPPMANTGTGPQKPAATVDTRAGSDRSLA